MNKNVADDGHDDNLTTFAKVSSASTESANLGFRALEIRSSAGCSLSARGASAMRCSDLPLGGGLWSGRGADAPSFFAPVMAAASNDCDVRVLV